MSECLKMAGLLSLLILGSCTYQAGGIHMPSRGSHRVLTAEQVKKNNLSKVRQKVLDAKANSSNSSDKANALKLTAWNKSAQSPSIQQQAQLADSMGIADLTAIGGTDFPAPDGTNSIDLPNVAIPSIGLGGRVSNLDVPELKNTIPVAKPMGALRRHDYAAQEEIKSIRSGAQYRPNSVELNGMRSPRLPHELPLKQ